jgi:hypothetical protein
MKRFIYKNHLYENIDLSNPINGGVGDGQSFDIGLLAQGAAIEKEHVGDLNDPAKLALALDIARDHLAESPRYYEELAKMEKKLEGESNNVEDGTVIDNTISNSNS